jgi:hypothetical protein
MSARVHDTAPPDASSAGEPYSPLRRTALLLTGTGTAGAYHAGALRALTEAGVKIDVVAGRGIGAIGALFAAIDGASRLWDDHGFWRQSAVRRFYRWHPLFAFSARAFILALVIVIVPLLVAAAGLIVLPVDFALSMTGWRGLSGTAAAYLDTLRVWFGPAGLPTWIPRLALLALGLGLGAAVVSAWLRAASRRQRGPFWWRLVPAPLSAAPVAAHCWASLWDVLRGAAPLKQPAPADLAGRYAEVLADNLGQPGFRELLIAVHDVDVNRDLIFALVAESRRREMIHRPTALEADARQAEIVDLSGVSRAHLVDAVAASCAVPLVTEAHPVAFAPDGYWRGETHRLCDRPGSVSRLVAELALLGIEQIVVVSAAPEGALPHTLAPPRLDLRGRVGEYLRSAEAAVLNDLLARAAANGPRLFAIRPAHNPVGPLDCRGGFDDRSDRPLPLLELMSRGYHDAYHQFIEPVVGASGESVGHAVPDLPAGRRSRRA